MDYKNHYEGEEWFVADPEFSKHIDKLKGEGNENPELV